MTWILGAGCKGPKLLEDISGDYCDLVPMGIFLGRWLGLWTTDVVQKKLLGFKNL